MNLKGHPIDFTNHAGRKRKGMKKPDRNQVRIKNKRPIPSALGVQNAAKLTRKRHEKLISQLSKRTMIKASY